MSEAVIMCSKCSRNPRADEDGSNPWCKECRAEYARQYAATKEGRAFARGAAAMRDHLAERFVMSVGGGSCTGHEAAAWIRAEALPQS